MSKQYSMKVYPAGRGRDVYRNIEICGDEPSTDIILDKIGLYKGQKFSLHYDFGDDWMFTITVSKISEAEDSFEPHIVKSKGHIQQYPDFDEEDWDYE